MLDLSRNTACDIEFGTNRHARLAYLTLMLGETRIHGGAARAYLGAQHFGQLVNQTEILFRAHAVTAGHYSLAPLY